jgi:hypothetical protein
VPEYEQTKLRFGSFTSGLDLEQVSASTPQDTEQPEQLGGPFPILLGIFTIHPLVWTLSSVLPPPEFTPQFSPPTIVLRSGISLRTRSVRYRSYKWDRSPLQVGLLVPAPKCAQIQTLLTGGPRTYMWDRYLSPSSVFPTPVSIPNRVAARGDFRPPGAILGRGHPRARVGCMLFGALARAAGCIFPRRTRLPNSSTPAHAGRSPTPEPRTGIADLLPRAATTPPPPTVRHSSAPTTCPPSLCRRSQI